MFFSLYIQCCKSLEQLEQELGSPCHYWLKAVPDFEKKVEKAGQSLAQIANCLNLSPYIATLASRYRLVPLCVSSSQCLFLPIAY